MINAIHQFRSSRRRWLGATASGLTSVAVAGIARRAAASRRLNPLAIKRAHSTPTAQRIIFIFLDGGPSQLDLTDYKPKLQRDSGKTGRKGGRLLGTHWKFSRHGESGLWMSELIPHIAQVADELCIVQSMQTSSRAHPLATPLLHTGSFQFRRPSVGAWVLYGLGTENDELPGFITINPPRSFGGPSNYGSAFLPSAYQGTPIGAHGDDVDISSIGNLANQKLPSEIADDQFALLQSMNDRLVHSVGTDPVIEGALDATELSRRMETAIPAVMDLSQERQVTLDSYGIGGDQTDRFARQCLYARRFAEAGVRYIEISLGGWDHHSRIKEGLTDKCERVDQPIGALIKDLRLRGMLDDTLVVIGGEFGRTPEAQVLEEKIRDGRDHNADGYSMWLAGGGVKRGFAYGQTDELGYEAVENPVHLHDLHATMLHTLGLDHEQLTYRYAGRDFRLTDVHGNVVHDILA